jgi:diguanylate cyclase (GGDEF)-like protein
VKTRLVRRLGVVGRGRGLEEVVDDSFRLVITGAGVVVLLTVSLLAWLLLYSRPSIARYERGVTGLADSHAAMLNQSLAIRGYLATGDRAFLGPYEQGLAEVGPANQAFLPLARDKNLTADIVSVNVQQQVWSQDWARIALRDAAEYPGGSRRLSAFLLAGKAQFDQYRSAHRVAMTGARSQLDYLRATQSATLLGASASAMIVGGLTLVAARNRRRALRSSVLTPVTAVLEGLESVAAGDLERRITADGATELTRIVAGFNAMSDSLAQARSTATARERHIHDQSARLRSILKMVREIGGSLNLKYVLESVVDGVATTTGAQRVVVWLVGENEATIVPTHDSDPTGRDQLEPVEMGTGVVGRAAKYGRTTTGTPQEGDTASHLSVPLIIGARVVGVLELELEGHQKLTDDQVEVLETLSIHAAAALEAARLHQTTSHASEHDALTRLANRRRLEADLTLECDRSLRYARPLSLIMLDLDHFKRLNDTHGHAKGDEILQGVAETITSSLRSTDSAYRYGGEELVVLARESDVAGAMGLAERIRGAIERRFAGTAEGNVTASLGVAGIPENAVSAKALVAAADGALYTAKAEGRNRVCAAPSETFVHKETAATGPSSGGVVRDM